ncbi:flagellar hook-length control protein FliK [Pseudodesulfovibrio sp. F-1]|uniref:Flagellar hook-length control protein FliK n=2 Tax=Pseudodesulfovibrio alkaliphilus TaxID=2661613 RepID=A0A7K1KL61_9BACT|nr:flagellar hook-length control protein FliK [Pseudodesulfovibrio alkaliphilus]
MFAEVFAMHSASVESELSMAPVATREKMLDAAPQRQEEVRTVAQGSETRSCETGKEALRPAHEARDAKRDEQAERDERDERMTREDFEKIKDDLKAYGLTDDEIKALEKKVGSDEGMTWKEFVAALATKMEATRKAALGDEQKGVLANFFAKLGFSAEESDTLLARLENGEQDKVMGELQAKLAELPKARQLLLTKEEIVAFSSAMGFSGEFTTKLKEMFGSGTTAKEMREAFTLIRQEMSDMNAKDRALVRAVGKAFAQAMGETARESSAARDLEAAVDLTPRVAEDAPKAKGQPQAQANTQAQAKAQANLDANVKTNIKTDAKANAGAEVQTDMKANARADAQTDAKANAEVKAQASVEIREDFKEAVDTRRHNTGAEAARKSSSPLPEKAGETRPDSGQGDPRQDSRSDADAESNKAWNNFFGRLKDDSGTAASRTQVRTETIEQALRTDVTDAASRSQNRAWEKVDAPRVMRQVENAVFRNLTNGTKQLTLQLTPENLGKLNIMLQVQGKEVNAVIRADNPESARIINENIEVIRSALEGQGLKVEKLDVQAGLAGNQDNAWTGHDQHNLSREREIMAAMRRHMRAMRGDTGAAGTAAQAEMVHSPRTENGIHVIA